MEKMKIYIVASSDGVELVTENEEEASSFYDNQNKNDDFSRTIDTYVRENGKYVNIRSYWNGKME